MGKQKTISHVKYNTHIGINNTMDRNSIIYYTLLNNQRQVRSNHLYNIVPDRK